MDKLIKTDKNLALWAEKTDLTDIIKPLKREIPLMDYYVAELNEQCSDLVFVKIKALDELQLKADNICYKSKSVGVYFGENRIGGLYAWQDEIPYNLLTGGKELKAIVKERHVSMGKKVLLLSVKMLDF